MPHGVFEEDQSSQLPASVVSASWVLPSGGDDTSAINAAINAGHQLGDGTFQVAGLLLGMPLGQGPDKTILQATNAAAGIQLGPTNGNSPVSAPGGVFGSFTFDGANIAGSGQLVSVNAVGATILPIRVINSLGDGILWLGQNCTFVTPFSQFHLGCGWVQDNGAGGALVLNYEFSSCARYHWESRQTVAPLPGGGYAVPTNNTFIAGRLERSNGGTLLGNLHHIAGDHNTFLHSEFTSDVAAAPNVRFDVDATPHESGFLLLENPEFNGAGNASGAVGIQSGTNSLGANYGVILRGETMFGSLQYLWDWASTTPARDESAVTQFGANYSKGSGGKIQRTMPAGAVAAFQPSEIGLLASSIDPAIATVGDPLSAGFIFLVRIDAQEDITPANLLIYVSTAGATLTAGQCLAGVYDSVGNLRLATADQSASWTSIGRKVMTLTRQGAFGATLPGGVLAGGVAPFYWLAVLANGTTPPQIAAANSITNANIGRGAPYAAAVPGASHRFGYESAGGRTALPSSLSGLTITDSAQTKIPWLALT